MGLDGVELLLSIEETFGIAITDPEAEACATPGAVIDLVLGKLRTTDEQVCVSQRAFYLLRKGLSRTLGVWHSRCRAGCLSVETRRVHGLHDIHAPRGVPMHATRTRPRGHRAWGWCGAAVRLAVVGTRNPRTRAKKA
jgi:hypothetical protein